MLDLERKLLLESLPGMAYRCDVGAPWAMQYVSPGLRFVCSYSEEDFVSGRVHWGELIHPDDLLPIDSELEDALRSRRHFNLHYRIRDPQLGLRWVNEAGQGIFNAGGAAEALVGFIIDVTEHEDVQARLREAEQRYALAAKATGEIVWDREVPGNQARRIVPETSHLAEPGDDASGYEWWAERVHPDDAPKAAEAVERLISGGGTHFAVEYRFRRPDGTWAHVYDQGFLLPRNGEGPRRMVGSMQDISERKEAQAQVDRLQAELIDVSRNSAMSVMAATLAHELNQPLAAAANYLVGSGRVAARELQPESMIRTGISEAELQIRRAGEIIRRTRGLVEGKETRREKVSITDLMERTRKLLSAGHVCRNLKLVMNIDPALDAICVDPIQIEQVLLNLLRNACEAMADKPSQLIEISAAMRDPRFVELSISDTGSGLPEASLESLFTSYGESATGGMGVGLLISRTIVERHGGSIWARNNPEGGATFFLRLPTGLSSA